MKRDISYLLKRGVSEVIVQEELTELLRSGKKLRLKEGFDPASLIFTWAIWLVCVSYGNSRN